PVPLLAGLVVVTADHLVDLDGGLGDLVVLGQAVLVLAVLAVGELGQVVAAGEAGSAGADDRAHRARRGQGAGGSGAAGGAAEGAADGADGGEQAAEGAGAVGGDAVGVDLVLAGEVVIEPERAADQRRRAENVAGGAAELRRAAGRLGA